VINSVIDNPQLGQRVKLLFSRFYNGGLNGALNHIVLGKSYYANSDDDNPVSQYGRAIKEFQVALKILLELGSKENDGKIKGEIDAKIIEARQALERATNMKKAAQKMEDAYKIVENPSLANTSAKENYWRKEETKRISLTAALTNIKTLLGEAAAAEREALIVGFTGTGNGAKDRHLRKQAEIQRTNFVDICRMSAEVLTRLNNAKDAEAQLANASLYVGRGFKSRGDYKSFNLDKMEELIKKFNAGEIDGNKLKEAAEKKLPFLEEVKAEANAKRKSL